MPHNISARSSRSRFAILLVVVFALGLSLAACSSSSKSSGSSSADITIKDLAFTVNAPVQTGSKVTVQNNDTVTHTVTSDDGKSFNVTVNPGKTATFTAPGDSRAYKFHCNIHSSMHGTLTVQ